MQSQGDTRDYRYADAGEHDPGFATHALQLGLQGAHEFGLFSRHIVGSVCRRLCSRRQGRNDCSGLPRRIGLGRELGKTLLFGARSVRLATRFFRGLQGDEPICLSLANRLLCALGFGTRCSLGTLQLFGALLFFLPAQRVCLAQFLFLFDFGGDTRRLR